MLESMQKHPDAEHLHSPEAEETKRQLAPRAAPVGICGGAGKTKLDPRFAQRPRGKRLLPSRRCTWFKPWQRNSNAAPSGDATEARRSRMIHTRNLCRTRMTENIESGSHIGYFPYSLNNCRDFSSAAAASLPLSPRVFNTCSSQQDKTETTGVCVSCFKYDRFCFGIFFFFP